MSFYTHLVDDGRSFRQFPPDYSVIALMERDLVKPKPPLTEWSIEYFTVHNSIADALAAEALAYQAKAIPAGGVVLYAGDIGVPPTVRIFSTEQKLRTILERDPLGVYNYFGKRIGTREMN